MKFLVSKRVVVEAERISLFVIQVVECSCLDGTLVRSR